MKKQLILVVSDRMDNNTNRNEDELIRIGGQARKNLELEHQKDVELWPTNSTADRINRSRLLTIHQAYQADMKKLIEDDMSRNKRMRVGFVTTRTFEYICGNGAKSDGDIWISDGIADTVIGGDPEFILIGRDNQVQYAGRIDGWGDNRFGADGPLPELRPDPTIEVEDFVDSLHDILCNHPSGRAIWDLKWKAGCCHLGRGNRDNREAWPIGGHIHIGTPKQLASRIQVNSFKKMYYAVLQRLLDEFLSIPMMKIDKKDESIQRRRSYGKYGDHRTQHNRLEYRTLSGMWMAHPRLALVTLGTAKAIFDAFYKALESKDYAEKYLKGTIGGQDNLFSRCDDWTKSPLLKDLGITIKSSEQMKDILNGYNIKFDKHTVDTIKRKLRKLPTYRKYSEHIDGLIELVGLPAKEITKIDCDIKKTWVGNKEFII